MIKKSWKILLVISFVLLLTACQSGKKAEQKEELVVKTEIESKIKVGDNGGSKVVSAQENNQVLGEKKKKVN